MLHFSRQLPKKWELNKLLLPAKNYTYFDQWQKHKFQHEIREHSAVNAWWMAECALLAYEKETVVKKTLKNIAPFTKDGVMHCLWLNKGSTQGFILESDNFFLLSVRGTEMYRISDIVKEPRNIIGMIKDLRIDAQLSYHQQSWWFIRLRPQRAFITAKP